MRFLVFGTGPQGLGARGADLRRRLATLVGAELRAQVDIVAVASYAELTRALGSGVVSCAWLPPAVVADAVDRHGAAIVGRCQRHGVTAYRSALFMRAGAAASGPDGLRGLRVGWVDPESCAGHLFARLALLERGLTADALFREQRMLGSHTAVARAVRDGVVDVGASYAYLDAQGDVVDAGWSRVVDTPSMRAVLTSQPLPTDAICVSPAADAGVRSELAALFASLHELPEGRTLLGELLQAERIVPAGDDEYAGVRRARALARGDAHDL